MEVEYRISIFPIRSLLQIHNKFELRHMSRVPKPLLLRRPVPILQMVRSFLDGHLYV